MSIFILLRPRLLAIRNRWIHGGTWNALLRNLPSLLLAAALMVIVYEVTDSALEQLPPEARPSSTRFLSIVLSAFLGMLTLSAAIQALGTFFLARDLEILGSLPITTIQFVAGRTMEVYLRTCWISFLISIPSLSAYYLHNGGTILPVFPAAFIVALFLFVPAACGVLASIAFANLCPARRTRETLFLAFLAVFGGALVWLSSTDPRGESSGAAPILLPRAIAQSSIWTPAEWCAKALFGLVGGAEDSYLDPAVRLATLAALLFALCCVASRSGYRRGFDMAQSKNLSGQVARFHLPKLFVSPRLAFATKELRMFSRDITQALQLFLLLGVTFTYLYHLRALKVIGEAQGNDSWWQSVVFLCNALLASFVVVAISTRFVFPSVSHEGSSFWIVRTAPLGIRMFLGHKQWAWGVPLGIIGTVVALAGGWALCLDFDLIVLTAIFGFLCSVGIAGVAVGMGARFAVFDWEHITQVSTSLGCLAFSGVALILVGANMAVACALAFVRGFYLLGYPIPAWQWHASQVLFVLLLYLVNRVITRVCMAIGARSLDARDCML